VVAAGAPKRPRLCTDQAGGRRRAASRSSSAHSSARSATTPPLAGASLSARRGASGASGSGRRQRAANARPPRRRRLAAWRPGARPVRRCGRGHLDARGRPGRRHDSLALQGQGPSVPPTHMKTPELWRTRKMYDDRVARAGRLFVYVMRMCVKPRSPPRTRGDRPSSSTRGAGRWPSLTTSSSTSSSRTGIRPHWSLEVFSDLDANVRQSLARITTSPFIPRKDSVRAFVYDVHTGAVREVT
jgi:hypothetical protein